MAFCVCILYNETHSCFSSASTTDWMYIRGMEIGRGREREREKEQTCMFEANKLLKEHVTHHVEKKHSTCECGVRYIVVLICMRSHSHTLRQAHTCMHGEDGQSASEKKRTHTKTALFSSLVWIYLFRANRSGKHVFRFELKTKCRRCSQWSIDKNWWKNADAESGKWK